VSLFVYKMNSILSYYSTLIKYQQLLNIKMSPLYEKLISLSKQHAANVYRSYEQW